jgi:hypothetical protein
MNNIYRSLGFGASIILATLALVSCSRMNACEVQTQDAQKESVQLNDFIYNRVFGSKSCSPQKLILRLPINLKIENQNKESRNQQYTTKITTLVTFASNYNNFYITRIDKSKKGFIYTNKDSCLAWKWSKDDKQKVLNLTMERNLQIRDPNLESVIFIVSLPIEIKEAGIDVTLERYTWDSDTARVGAIHNFNLRKEYPEIKNILRQKERGSINTREGFSEGKKVSNEIAAELIKINDMGGVHLDRDLAVLLKAKYEKTYHDSPDYPACEIPIDFKK